MRYISLDLHPITIAALNPLTDDRQPDGWHSREAAQAQRDDRPSGLMDSARQTGILSGELSNQVVRLKYPVA